ncbi:MULTISPECIES: hypothetical protein [unclassified Bosea (in: a-proteobacteria)]|uniref:hypothetical protein n=1 Tax=unclassified Bosea (in: a-proteobacteria) TaxID=2653178 RepID=UPI000F7EE515|nr:MULTISPECIES: hypothetical protein [unclassified Bosea (in: a-proteobacteria)]
MPRQDSDGADLAGFVSCDNVHHDLGGPVVTLIGRLEDRSHQQDSVFLTTARLGFRGALHGQSGISGSWSISWINSAAFSVEIVLTPELARRSNIFATAAIASCSAKEKAKVA